MVIGLIALPLLMLLALYPCLIVVRQSFGEPATLAYWNALLLGQASPLVPFWTPQHTLALLWRPLFHSFVVAGLTTLLATGFGAVLAWLSAATDLRYTRLLQAIALLHLILPPFTLALAWQSLARWLHLPEVWLYGPLPMVLVLTLHFYAFTFLLVSAASRNLNASLIEAAQVHGARPGAIVRRIVWPLLYPAALAGAGFTAFAALAAFAPMQLLGGGSRPYYVLATQIFSLYRNSLGDPRSGVFAAGLALALTLVSLWPFLFFLRLLRHHHISWAVVGGRGHRPWLLPLGRWREPLSAICLVGSCLTLAAPMGVLLIQSLSEQGELTFNPVSLTLQPYQSLFSTNLYLLSLGNSFLLAAITATAGMLLTLPLAYCLHRTRQSLLQGVLYLLVYLPFLLPGVVLGLTYFVLISRPLPGTSISLRFLYGSLLLAVVVSLVKHLPFGVQTHLNTLMQIDPALEEAAYTCRASFWRVLQRIFLPLLRRGTLTAWLLLFVFVFKEIDLLAFVYAPVAFSTGSLGWSQLTRSPPVMYQVFAMINSEEQPELRAQGVALLLIVCLVLLAATSLATRLGRSPLTDYPHREL
jgi:iron(III) transport system permease protein